MAKITFELKGESKKEFEFDRPIDFKLVCAHEINAIPESNNKTYLIALLYDPEQPPFWIIGSRWECVEVIDFAIREMFCIEYDDWCDINVFSYDALGGTDQAMEKIKSILQL